jgi:hypothetical protein
MRPELLNYWCKLQCRAKTVPLLKVEALRLEGSSPTCEEEADAELAVLEGKPILAIRMSNLKMAVGRPNIVRLVGDAMHQFGPFQPSTGGRPAPA